MSESVISYSSHSGGVEFLSVLMLSDSSDVIDIWLIFDIVF